MSKGRIIIVDDEESILDVLGQYLNRNGYEVDTFSDGKEALLALKHNNYDVMVTDLVMPKVDGLQLINYLQKEYINTIAILMTGYGSLTSAIDAMRLGAFDYVLKPFKPEDLLGIVVSAMNYTNLLRSDKIPEGLVAKAGLLRRYYVNKDKAGDSTLQDSSEEKFRFGNIIGNSFAMQRVFEMIDKLTDTNATVLITGESGVGKELVAKAIHYRSARRANPLVIMNCAAIPETLLESELFGYEKGAFTGAVGSRPGKFEFGNGGTIFLDEIGDMSINLQVKLLRVLQEKTFERIGGTKTVKVDVRIVAATNKNLEMLVMEGKFREDLYYRLNVVPVRIPPLRERRHDIPHLICYFLEKSNEENNTNVEGFTEEAMTTLMDYHYPGNVRELQNLIERLVVLTRTGHVDVKDLPEKFYTVKRSPSLIDKEKGYDSLVSEYEKQLILEALEETNGVKSKAAQILNMNRTTLIEKMKRLGI